MGEIRVLPPEVRKLIAAGEVIERPANVVKELIENSLDAQAKSIYVETLQGGKRLIEVRDNGKGILKEDLPKVILEGATSKIEKAEDLFSVKTLGFRGEALSSIAKVSRITLTSRHFSQDRGYQLLARGGKAEYLREVAHPVGTTVVVEELFFNLPVRLKFLKTAKTERKLITETVVTYALANPQVAFTLIQEGKTVLELKPSSVEERILEIFKLDYPPFRVQAQNEIGKAEIFYYTNFRSNKFFVFLNGRPIFNKELQTYLKNKLGYKTLAVLFLEIPPYLVDVNVHPRKEEVRFLQQRKVLNLLGKLFGEEKTPTPPTEVLKSSAYTEYLKPPQFEILGQIEETLIVAYRKGFIYFFDQHLLDEVVNFALTRDETKACKSSIKAGDKLSKKQMEALLSRWEALGQPKTCPHGRPVFFKIPVGEIFKKLGRG
ncbi:MAG: DNA mismatch repair endonuclease MutL [Gammaproteobacteria bacterium]|nr:MAG: DNA mismatch repair endonuclease MutL [Gammaproteobacteria bacterium]